MQKLFYLFIFLIFITLPKILWAQSEFVHISKERKIYMHCAGKGYPEVILVSGFPERGDASWELPAEGSKNQLTVFSGVSKFTKVCDYDRPGTIKVIGKQILKSRSTPVSQPVTAKNFANDLYDLIHSTQIKKPVIMVAHSAGGLGARLYAMKHPRDVAGLILLDVTNEKLYSEWSDKEIEVFKYGTEKGVSELYSQYKAAEKINFDKSFEQLNHYQNHKLTMPSIILTPIYLPHTKEYIKEGIWPEFVTEEMGKSIVQGINRASRQLADTFKPKAKLIAVKNSGHFIQKDQPELVIKLIREMVEHQRKNARHYS